MCVNFVYFIIEFLVISFFESKNNCVIFLQTFMRKYVRRGKMVNN